MKTFNKVIAIILLVFSLTLALSFALGFKKEDVVEFFAEDYKYEEIGPHVFTDSVNRLDLDLETKNVTINTHEEDNIIISYYQKDKETIDVDLVEKTLKIKQKVKKIFWGINFQFSPVKHRTIEILVPSNNELTINISAQTANINLDNLILDKSMIKTETGRITFKNISGDNDLKVIAGTGSIYLKNVSFKDLMLFSETGNISLKDFVVDDLNVKTSTGFINLENGEAQDLEITSSTGKIDLKNLNLNEAKITSSTSNVKGEEVAASNIQINVSTGSVSLIGDYETHTLVLKTNTGSVKINAKKQAKDYTIIRNSNTIVIQTTTGNISIDYSK